MNKENKKKAFSWQNASYPLVMAVAAFICFLLVYWIIAVSRIIPDYIINLLFIIPALIFGIIAYVAGRLEKCNIYISIATTLLIPILSLISLIFAARIIFGTTLFTTQNHKIYEKAINFEVKRNNDILKVFPKGLPSDASDLVFYYYHSGSIYPSKNIVLKITVTSNAINEYINLCESIAIIPEEEVVTRYDLIGYDNVDVSNLIVYVIIDENENFSTISINQITNEIIFYAEFNK